MDGQLARLGGNETKLSTPTARSSSLSEEKGEKMEWLLDGNEVWQGSARCSGSCKTHVCWRVSFIEFSVGRSFR